MKTKNIMIVGVGGQGSLLASKLLGRLFLTKGYDIKVSEVHGMSQRGGSRRPSSLEASRLPWPPTPTIIIFLVSMVSPPLRR